MSVPWLPRGDKHKRITISSQACLQTIYNIITASGLWTHPRWILTRIQVSFLKNVHAHKRARTRWIKHCVIYMMYSLKICQHLTLRSNTNTHESERGTQNSLFLISGQNNAIVRKKNLIEKSAVNINWASLGANGSYILQSEREGGIKLISTWVTLLLPYSVREDSGIQIAAATPFGLITLKNTHRDSRGGTPVSAGIMEIDRKV